MYSDDVQEHDDLLGVVLGRLEDAELKRQKEERAAELKRKEEETILAVLAKHILKGLFVKLKKTELFRRDVNMLGHLVGEGGIRLSPAKLATIEAVMPGLRDYILIDACIVP